MIERTAERMEQVIALTQQNYSAAQIAAIMGLTPRSVTRLRARAGIAQPRPALLTEQELARAKALLEDGCSYDEAARTIGRSSTALVAHFPGYSWDRTTIAKFARYAKTLIALEGRTA